MKRIVMLLILAFSIFNFQFSIVKAQIWKELMDSTKFYHEKQDFETALKWVKLALPQAEKEFGELDTNYSKLLESVMEIYYYQGKYDTAIVYCEELLKINRQIFKNDGTKLASSLAWMAFLYNALGDYRKVEPYYIESLGIARRMFKTDNSDLASLILNVATYYKDIGDYKKAGQLFIESLEMYRRLNKSDHPDLARCFEGTANYYFTIGDYQKAEQLNQEALAMTRRLYKTDNLYLAKSISSMALFYYTKGDYPKAEPLFIEAFEMYRRMFKSDHPALAGGINNLAVFYNAIGDVVKAEPLLIEALEIRRRLFKIEYPNLASSINNLALFYYTKGDYPKAEPLFIEAFEMAKRIFKSDHPELAKIINNLAFHYYTKGDYQKAEPLYIESLEIGRRIFNSDHPDLATSINNLGYFYHGRGRYAEAEPLCKEALEMFRRIFKGNHSSLANSISNLALLYSGTGRYSEAEPLYVEGLRINMNMLNNYFPALSEKEKKQLWNTVYKSFEHFNSFSTHRAKENPGIICNMYDIQLYTKSLLFNSANRIKSRIMNSGDSALTYQYRRWSDIREYLVQLYKLTDAQLKKKGIRIDSIEKAANELEKQVSLKSEEFKQSYEKKKVNWKSVQTLLKPDEAAVEIVRFRLFEKNRWTDTVHYAFLIITDQTEDHPELVLLENGMKLENEYYNDYRKFISDKTKDNISYGRYWGKLNEKLKGYRKVFLSADGIYNKLNPSTLMLPDGRYLLDLQDIQQLNSTKDILMGFYKTKEESNIYNSAVLVGNPDFALPEEKVKEVGRKIRGEKEEEKSYEVLANARGLELIRLPGTEKEIRDIEKFLKSKKWDVYSYLGDMAVKEAVRNANSPRILHIATHGLFLEDVKKGGKELFGFEEQKMIDNPLLRSGLFFSGADNYLNADKQIIAGEENGLLTAYEAMNLNLDKTELVVLSACETGLGEIQNGEGVFGLRRAFQQAGAKTVLMSLWKVNDESTQELMSNFYKNWVSGMTKREAFAKAQQEIRNKYKYPYYWGAFVMVGE